MPSKNFLDKYNYKIISVKKLKKKIGSIGRKEKVTMCHGHFDVVHPGHIRHLVYAKSRAPILIVSITPDKMISKGNYRPHVPEKLRAFNLAALEIVDYVIIDNNNTPIKNLEFLKPNYFAKGFEYSNYLNSKTNEEKEIVEKYGGEMIFTPGDIIYSSTKIIDEKEPDINKEKIINFFNNNNITFNKVKKIIKRKTNFTVHVIGDVIIDKYTNTNLIGLNAKTPTPSVLFKNERKFIGGAAIVAMHLKKAGINTVFTSVTGKDDNSKLTKSILKKNKIVYNIYEDGDRTTTEKNTIDTDGYKTLKIDKVDNAPINSKNLKFLENKILKTKCNAVIFSDFRHGIFNKFTIEKLNNVLNKKKNILKIADSQVASRWGNICDFKNFDLITPNEKEARFSLADQDSNISELTRELEKKAHFKNLILKLSSRGIFVVSESNVFSLPSLTSTPKDAVGAGDALLAGTTYGLLTTRSIEIASFIGLLFAACECEIDGNVPIDKENVLNKLNSLESNINY